MEDRLGQNLRRLRQERGLTQERLSELSGVAQPTISGIESGGRGWRGETVVSLALALGIDLEDLFLCQETRERLSSTDLVAGLEAEDIDTIRRLADSLRERSISRQRGRTSA